MAKKILSVLIAVLMVASLATMSIGTASAAEEHFSGGTVYWECPWDVAKVAYCHVYGHHSGDLYSWQTKNEKMTKVEGNKWSYEIPEGPYDQIIFSIDTGAQTFDLVLTDDCIGKTAVTDTDTMIENPQDSNKSAARTTWDGVDVSVAGPHLAITSIGHIVGEVLCPSESGADMVASFISTYLSIQPEYVTKEVLADAMSKANTTGADVYAVLQNNSEFTMLDEAKELLGVSDGNNGGDNAGDNNNGGDSNNGGDNNSSNNSTNSNNSNNSTSSNRSNTSTTSKTSSGTTTTGDSTPFVVLGIVLVAALGVAVVAAKKKVSE